MEIKALVNFRGGRAHYTIRSGDSGLYHATLLNYDGNLSVKPPDEITIIRGIRQWTGSYNDDLLIDRLGEIIEEAIVAASINKDGGTPGS